MPNSVGIKTNFSTGIVSPGIAQRVDWDKQASAIKDAENMLISPTGGLRKRPGTYYLGDALEVRINGELKPPRLIKFEFSLGQTYMLEFGDKTMRFWMNDFLIEDPNTNKPYQIRTPYAYSEVLEFSWAQYKDLMYFTHWDLPTQILTRGPSATHTNWWWDENAITAADSPLAPTGLDFVLNANNMPINGRNGTAYTVTAKYLPNVNGATNQENGESRGGYTLISAAAPVGSGPPLKPPNATGNDINDFAALAAWISTYKAQYGSTPYFPVLDADLAALVNVGNDLEQLNVINRDFCSITYKNAGYVTGEGGGPASNYYHSSAYYKDYNTTMSGNTLYARLFRRYIHSSAYFVSLTESGSWKDDDWWDVDWSILVHSGMTHLGGYQYYPSGGLFWACAFGHSLLQTDRWGSGRDNSDLRINDNWQNPGWQCPTTNIWWIGCTSIRDYFINRYMAGSLVSGQNRNTLRQSIANYMDTYVAKVNNKFKWDPSKRGGAVDTKVAYYNVYRKVLDVTGTANDLALLGRVPASGNLAYSGGVPTTTLQYEDTDVTTTVPNYSSHPTESNNYFDTPETYPNTCNFFQQRFIVGSTKKEPLMIGGSKPGAFNDFGSTANFNDVKEAWFFRLASKTSNPIKHIVPLKTLYIMSEAGAFINQATGPITVMNVQFQQQAYQGAASIPVVICDRTGIYVAINRQIMNSFEYNWSNDAFVDDNMLFAAQELTRGTAITSFDFFRPSISQVLVSLANGTGLACIFIPKSGFLGWTKLKTDGEIAQICAYTNDEGYDEPYMVVKRFKYNSNATNKQRIEYYAIERMHDIRPFGTRYEINDDLYLDCALTGEFTTPVNSITGLGHLRGREVCVLADGDVYTATVTTTDRIGLPKMYSNIQIGLPYAAYMETLDFELLQGLPTLRSTVRSIISAFVEFEDTLDAWYQINGGDVFPVLLQSTNQIGSKPIKYSGDIQLNALTDYVNGTRVKIYSEYPLPMTINSMLVNLEYNV